MISNALFRYKGRLSPRFLPVFILAVLVMMAVGCGGNVPPMQSSSMGAVSVSVSDPPSCAASTSGATAAIAGRLTIPVIMNL